MSVKTIQCYWKGCNEEVIVDSSIESSGIGRNLGLTVVDYCPFHKLVQRKKYELFGNLDKKKHHSETANYLFKNDRKKYNKIERNAIKLVLKDIVRYSHAYDSSGVHREDYAKCLLCDNSFARWFYDTKHKNCCISLHLQQSVSRVSN